MLKGTPLLGKGGRVATGCPGCYSALLEEATEEDELNGNFSLTYYLCRPDKKVSLSGLGPVGSLLPPSWISTAGLLCRGSLYRLRPILPLFCFAYTLPLFLAKNSPPKPRTVRLVPRHGQSLDLPHGLY